MAIGSGKTPTKDEIDEVVSFIKKKLNKKRYRYKSIMVEALIKRI